VTAMIDTGTEAPTFSLPNQDGEPVSLEDQRGKWVVLYFYPRADTPGCTTQACGIRDRDADYSALDAVVLGVSPDSPDALRKFADKYGLPFTLLGDADHSVAESDGTCFEKKNYGKTYMGVQRATFLIDPDGSVRHVIPKVKPATHDDEVLAALRELGAGQ
jgi:thioredoxin-dependent peroxiredoxin